MKLKNYCLVVLIGMLWSTGIMAGTVNINLADVGELAENIHGIGLTIIKANRGVIVVKDAPLQTQIDVTSD